MSLIGQSVERTDAFAKVTGRELYTGDIRLPGMVHAALVRSEFPRGRIDEVRAPGGSDPLAMVTAADVPAGLYGPFIADQPIFARGESRYEGEPIAAVVAMTPGEANAIAADVEVVCEPLEPIVDIDAALLPAARPVHGDRPGGEVEWLAERGLSSANCCQSYSREEGDVERALASAAFVFDDVFEVPAVQAFPLERFECIAHWTGQELHVWSPTQSPFVVRRDLAQLFDLSPERIRVTVPTIGGGFGAKLYTKIEPVTVACALAVPGRPVKLSLPARESATTITRHAARVRLRTGVAADGRILARDCFSLLNTGAYADAGARVSDKAGYRAPGPYRIEHLRSRACAIYTNLPPAGAYRGFGAPQVVWAYEAQMDLIAAALEIDPVELRRRNLLQRGDRFASEDAAIDCDLPGALDHAVSRLRSSKPPATHGRWRVGEACAVGLKDGGGPPTPTRAEVRVRPDGGATLFVGSTEIGQGMTTAFAQLVATELGIAVDQVDVPTPDTQSSPFDSGTEASRTLALVGNAVVSAASAARARLLSAFRSLHGLDGDAGSVEAGIVSASGRSSSIADVMRALSPEEREQIVGAGRFDPPVGTNVQGGFTTFWEPGVAAARVRVDVDTGAIEVLNYISVLDAGRAINPKLCEGQDLGAVMMALGHALTERLEYDQGRMLNASLVDYRLPGFGDMPDELETILIERGDGPGPHGSRGVGEAGSLAVGPVLANAVAHALGIRLLALPLTPEAVWRALGERVAAGARTS